MDQKELYIVRFTDGTGMNILDSSYQEVLAMYGEERIEKMEKRPYEGEQQK